VTGRIVLPPLPNGGRPHTCETPITQRDDWSMVGAVWQCDECFQHWVNKAHDLGGVWDKILPEQALQLIVIRQEGVKS